MKKIIVIGSLHHNTLGTIRCIGMADYKTDLILIGQDGYVSKSRYVNNTHIAKNETDILNILLDIYGKETENAIILSCTDGAQHILDENYDILNKNFDFYNCASRGKINHFMNKQVQSELANSFGLVVPYSQIFNRSTTSDISFPCLLKPLQSINGGKRIRRCDNLKELKDAIDDFDANTSILVQQFIDKEEEIVVVGCATKDNIDIPGYVQKYRDYNGGTLYSTVDTITNLPSQLIDKCKDMVKAISYEGLFGIEFIFSKGIYYFIEINLRTDATTYSLACAGANLPKSYIESKINGFYRSENISKKISSIVEFNDFRHRKHNKIPFKNWLKQYLSSECKYYWYLKDPLPFILAPLNLLKNH